MSSACINIAIEGCCHGELEKIYQTIELIQRKKGIKIDLLLCCGDFQATRNESDLATMAVPLKHRLMGTFYKYYTGEAVAPVMTIVIGGNHEASSYFTELPYGGFLAPNIYYMGWAGVISYRGIRIGGLSGIFKGYDYLRGHFEFPPFSKESKHSVYHVRKIDVHKLFQLRQSPHIMMSHDWPCGIHTHGDTDQLLSRKPFLREDIEKDQLGSSAAMDLLKKLKPDYWFSAHLHAKFAAIYQHADGKVTKFLALDKCLPRRQFLQVISHPFIPFEPAEVKLDLEWLSILHLLDGYVSVLPQRISIVYPNILTSSLQQRMEMIAQNLDKKVIVRSEDFRCAITGHDTSSPQRSRVVPQPKIYIHPYTQWLCCTAAHIKVPAVMYLEAVQRKEIVPPDETEYNLNTSRDDSFFNASSILDESSLSIMSELEQNVSINPDEILLSDEEVEDKIKDDYMDVKSLDNSGPDLLVDEDILTTASHDSSDYDIQNEEEIFRRLATAVQEVNEELSQSARLRQASQSSRHPDSPAMKSEAGTAENTQEMRTPTKFKRRNQSLYASTE